MSKRRVAMPIASKQKKATHSDADVKLPEDVGASLIQLRQRLADAANQAKPPVSHASYIDHKKKSKWADNQLSGYENTLDRARMELADAAREVNRLCGLLGIPATTTEKSSCVRWPSEVMLEALSFLGRDSLDALPLVSRQFRGAIAGSEMTRFALRPINEVKCGQHFVNSYSTRCGPSGTGVRIACATIDRQKGRKKTKGRTEKDEFEQEKHDVVSALVSVMPYMRASYCGRTALDLTTEHVFSLEKAEQDRILSALAGVAVGRMEIRISETHAEFLQEIVGALATIRSLKITHGRAHAETYGASFFTACTARGLSRLEFVEEYKGLAHSYHDTDDDSDDDDGPADGPSKPRRFIDFSPFCFAPAPSGVHRYVDVQRVDKATLVESLVKRSGELPRGTELTFTIANLWDLNIETLQPFKQSGAAADQPRFVISNLENDLTVEFTFEENEVY